LWAFIWYVTPGVIAFIIFLLEMISNLFGLAKTILRLFLIAIFLPKLFLQRLYWYYVIRNVQQTQDLNWFDVINIFNFFTKYQFTNPILLKLFSLNLNDLSNRISDLQEIVDLLKKRRTEATQTEDGADDQRITLEQKEALRKRRERFDFYRYISSSIPAIGGAAGALICALQFPDVAYADKLGALVGILAGMPVLALAWYLLARSLRVKAA